MGRELTRTEKAAIRRLVSKWCANYDRDCGCLPLDCECYMFGKCWTGRSFLWWTVQDSNPSYGFRVLFLHVSKLFFALEMRCVVPPESL